MSDALSRHAADADQRMRCHCLAHGRRQCSALAAVLPPACRVVIEALKQVLDHDAEARDQQMSPAARCAYHQASRRPIMDERPRGLDQQVEERLGEPHSAWGKARASRQGHWEPLRRWRSVVGAPLDNPLVERALQRCIRQRTHARCSKTAHRASSARGLTSLMATVSTRG